MAVQVFLYLCMFLAVGSAQVAENYHRDETNQVCMNSLASRTRNLRLTLLAQGLP